MDYKLSEVDRKLKQFTDKMGSDYFPLPVLLNYFHTCTLDFVAERVKEIEKTQEVVDDIRPLITNGKLPIAKDPNDATRWIAALPLKYFRLVSYDVLYDDNTRCRRADLLRHGEYSAAVLNPNKRPTKHYPIILQENNLFQIDSGTGNIPEFLKITYCKKPSFATVANKEVRVVNLPDEAIEKIMLSVVTRLFNSTGDQRTQSNYQLQEAFRKFSK